MARVGAGELPVEAEERRKRKLLCMEDLRLALDIGDGYLAQVPILAGAVANAQYLDTPGMDKLYKSKADEERGLVNGFTVNGAVKPAGLYSSSNLGGGDPMDIDDDFAWQGGSVKDVDELDSALDAVLEVGEM